MNLLPNLLSINLADKMLAANRRVLANETKTLALQDAMDQQIEKLRLGAEQAFKEGKTTETIDAARILGFDFVVSKATDIKKQNAAISHLPADRIFSTNAIRDVCLSYGLRFLPTALYKGALDDQIPAKLEEFKKLNGGVMPDAQYRIRVNSSSGHQDSCFFIAAPAESFALSPRPKDPLLFAYLGSDRWFLIHKWGQDLSIGAWVKQKLTAHWLMMTLTALIPIGLWIGFACAKSQSFAAGSYLIAGFISSIAYGIVAGPVSLDGGWRAFESHVTKDNWNSPFSN